MRHLEDRSFLFLVVIVTAVFAWIVRPFFGAVLWALVATIIFAPLYRSLVADWGGRRNRAALFMLLVIVTLVIVPAILITIFLLQEAATIYAKVESGQIDFGYYFVQLQERLPDWAAGLLDRFGLTDIGAVREKIVAGLTNSFRTLAGQAFTIGQSAFSFVMTLGLMLYLTFFLLRDGDELSGRLGRAVPIAPGPRRQLAEKFVAVIRATMKGSVVVAILQGAIGGVIFWALGIQGALLWGVLMAFLSLLPAIGTGLVWVPVAFYLLVTGAIWQGAVLVFCGIFVIGMVDNVLRPILVGRDLRMPDYVVLISTLGGLEVFGFNGFVVGPVIAALFMAVWDIMTEMRSTLAVAPFSAGEDDERRGSD